MRPIFILISLDSGAEMTVQVIDRTTRLNMVDHESVESNTLEIDLDDRDGRLILPDNGERLRLMLGYAGGPVETMGDFVVDEAGLSGPALRMTVSAKGVDLLKGLKAPRAEAWHALTLGELVDTICTRHGLEPRVHERIRPWPIPHIDQVGESDMALLTRFASEWDLTLRCEGDLLILRPHAARLDPTDPLLPAPTHLHARQISRYQWRRKSRTSYGAVRAWYRDMGQASRISVLVGDADGPVLDLRHDARDRDEAVREADARLAQLQRGTASLTLTLPGDPRIRAGARLTIEGLRDPIPETAWVVERVPHRIAAGGYTTEVEAVSTESI